MPGKEITNNKILHLCVFNKSQLKRHVMNIPAPQYNLDFTKIGPLLACGQIYDIYEAEIGNVMPIPTP